MSMYGISSASNLASLFGLGETSFSLPSGLKLPTVSLGTSLYGVNTAKPTSEDSAVLNIKTSASALKSALTDLTKNIRGSETPSLTEETSGEVEKFVSAYNELAGSNERLASQMTNASDTYKRALDKVGFSFDKEGKMSITAESLEKSLTDGSMKALFDGGATYGYAARLNQISGAAQQSPQYYAAQSNTYSSYNAERMNTQQNQVSFMLGAFYNAIM
ncbi:hypothetical protein FACS18949_09260 [Clostridia bacterium]|nr:hypothetical protein FACS18949_09260 [Clostridia bacterium]